MKFLYIILLLLSFNVFSGDVKLAWDPSTSPNVGGYEVGTGDASGNYSTTADVGNVTAYTLSGVNLDAKTYIAVRAYNTDKTVYSVYSNEVNVGTVSAMSFVVSGQQVRVTYQPIISGGTRYKWQFPGSTTAAVTKNSAAAVSVIYPSSGTYTVTLNITGNGHKDSETATIIIPAK